MKRIDGRVLGRWSLRLDAAYCALLGAAIALSSGWIAESIALPQPLIATIGVVVVLWAGTVLILLGTLHLRAALRFVMVANILAALAVGLTSVVGASLFAALAVIAIAIDIALFAASQAIAVRAFPATT